LALSEATPPILRATGIETGYGRKRVLTDMGIEVVKGEAVALLGHNGAGKTTFLQSIFGLQPLWNGKLEFDGATLPSRYGFRDAVRLGMAMIPSERFVFPELTVMENLWISARSLPREVREERFEVAYQDFPILKERSAQRAGSMSGGQQRMVSLAMALMTKPRLLLLDEPLLGLSPALAEQFMLKVSGLLGAGVSVVIVEQNVAAALLVANRIFIMRTGRMILSESASDFGRRGREEWWSLF
jgi:branched-chain amino acid transport system ATP-binding protein